MSPDDPRHGTYAGSQQHKRAGEPMCDPCRRAFADYQREWRSRPVVGNRDRERANARGRALWRLAALHPEDFERLYIEEVTPVMRKATP